MSKSIYDEALLKLREIAEKLTRKQWIELTNNIELIRSNLQQAQKQEKLLELYRELNNKILHTYDIFERMTNKEWKKFADIQQQIKELESE